MTTNRTTITLTADANTAIVRRLVEALWNGGDEAAADELIDASYIGQFAAHPEQLHGPVALRRFAGGYRAAFPDLQFHVEDLIAAGDRVVVRWLATGTQDGDLPGVPATGKRVAAAGIWIHRLAGGKVVEQWGVSDMLGLLQQLGAFPAPARAA